MKWKTIVVVALALLVGFGVVLRLGTRLPQAPAHQVFINGTLLTMDADNRVVEAIAVRGDRIEAVGSTDEIMALVEDDTLVTNLRGRTMLPGFIDAHGHFPYSGMRVLGADLNSPPVGQLTTMAEVLAALAEQAAITPAGMPSATAMGRVIAETSAPRWRT